MSTSGRKSWSSCLLLTWNAPSNRDPVPRDVEFIPEDLLRLVSPNSFGAVVRSKDRMAGKQAQMTPTWHSIVLQYPTVT